jgi:phosphate transport system substrate-binding protein
LLRDVLLTVADDRDASANRIASINYRSERPVNRWALIATAVFAAACSTESSGKAVTDKSGSATAAPRASSGVDLTGAGATFPFPIYDKWMHEYAAKTGVKINYQSIGSGGGIQQISKQTVDFGASDAPMSDSDMAKANGGPLLHIPTVIGLVAIAYNVPQITQPLKLTGPLVADIFLGSVTKWNDPRIAAANAGVALPSSDILVVHRSDGSGTTYIFSDYLSVVSPAWSSGPGKGKDLKWPVGLGGKGNEGVAGQIKQTPGAIGYVELAYAKQNHLQTALLENASHAFVAPSTAGATAAAESAIAALPETTDYRVSIVNARGAAAYPITSFTWLLVYKRQPDAEKAQKLVAFIRWALDEGEKEAAALDYAPLPASLIARLDARVDSIAKGGK